MLLLFVRGYDEDHLHILWRGESEDNDDDDDADFGLWRTALGMRSGCDVKSKLAIAAGF